MQEVYSCNPPVIHRDIKPSNILLSNRTGNSIGELYLVDFGSVQTAASKGEGTITIVGSYGYIPLEQFGGQTTTASDLYSLGMTLVYMMTGVHPAELPQHNGRVKFQSNQIGNGLKCWLIKITEPYLDKRFDSVKSAQAGLLAKEENSEGFANLRPRYSKIRLNFYPNRLEIAFTKETIKRKLSVENGFIYLCLFAGLFTCILPFTLYLLGIKGIIGILGLLTLTSYLWIDAFCEFTFFRPPQIYYSHEIVSINSDKSVQWTSYFNQKLKLPKCDDRPSPDEEVNLIVYHTGDKVTKYIGDSKHKLSLHTDKKEYIIGDHQQSKKELWWLGKEISNFLGLELQVNFPSQTRSLKSLESPKVQKKERLKDFPEIFNGYFY